MIRIAITSGQPAGPLAADFIQVREPELNARELASRVHDWMRFGKVLVNDRADVAIACGAAGVHLRGRSLSPARIRAITPRDFVIAVACHDADDVRRAEAEGADYAVLAPIFAPLSKPMDRPALGLGVLNEITKRAKIPVIALGGITSENADQCIAVGAAGVAGITIFR